MIHYFCTIVFNNAVNKCCENSNGLSFNIEIVAKDKESAKRVAELTAKNMCVKIFQSSLILGCGNIMSHECEYGHSSIQPL